MSRAYAGIGARNTPANIIAVMSELAAVLAVTPDGHESRPTRPWTLRSGHAPGADQAFERSAGTRAEVYLPWPTFELGKPVAAGAFVMPQPIRAAYTMAARFHPAWERLSQGAKSLHARNCHIMLGPALNDPVAFVVCWTPDGKVVGGTGQALRIAWAQGIEVFNLWRDAHRERVCGLVNTYGEAQ